MAEFILKHLRPDLLVESRAVGLKAKEGVLISKKTRTVLEEKGIPFNEQRRSKLLTREDIENFDVIYVMDKNNVKHYQARFGNLGMEKVKLLPALIGKDKIPDPAFSKGLDKYYEVFDLIYQCCLKLSKEV